MNTGDHETCSGERPQHHMEALGESSRISHGRDRIDMHRPAVDQFKTARSVHPGVGRHDKDRRSHPARCHDKTGEEVRAPRHALPAVEIDAQKNRFGKKRKALQGE